MQYTDRRVNTNAKWYPVNNHTLMLSAYRLSPRPHLIASETLPHDIAHRAHRQLAVVRCPRHSHDLRHLGAITALSGGRLYDRVQMPQLHAGRSDLPFELPALLLILLILSSVGNFLPG